MRTRTGREIHLAARPSGWPTVDDFRLVKVDVPEPGPDRVLIRNRYLSVDPYMRGRMNDVKSYLPPFKLDGGAVGEVVATGDGVTGLSPGDLVLHNFGWREFAVAPTLHARRIEPPAGIGPSAYLGALACPASPPMSACWTSPACGRATACSSPPRPVRWAASPGRSPGLRGASRVVGSAGSAEKVAYLAELGFDAGFDYHDGPVRDALAQAAPAGVAVPGPANLPLMIGKRLTLRGFLVIDHDDRRPEFDAEMAGWLRDGKVRCDETVVDGIANAPEAFIGMLRGRNTGKMVIHLS